MTDQPACDYTAGDFSFYLATVSKNGVELDPHPFTMDLNTGIITGDPNADATMAVGDAYTLSFLGQIPNQTCNQVDYVVHVIPAGCDLDTLTILSQPLPAA